MTSVDTTDLKLPFVHVNYKLKPGPAPTVYYGHDTLHTLREHLLAVYRALRTCS